MATGNFFTETKAFSGTKAQTNFKRYYVLIVKRKLEKAIKFLYVF